MSQHEHIQDTAKQFEQIGLTGDVISQMALDLSDDNPNCYANAADWAITIIATVSRQRKFDRLQESSLDELKAYLSYLIISNEHAGVVARLFVDTLFDQNVSSEYATSFVLFDGDTEIPQQPDYDTLAERVMYETELRHLKIIQAQLLNNSDIVLATLSLEELERFAQRLNAVNFRLEELKKPYVSYWGIRPAKSFAEKIANELSGKVAFLRHVEQTLTSVGRDMTLHALFGAKAANLLYLRDILAALRANGDEIASEYLDIPDFITVGVDTFRQWRGGNSIAHTITEVSEWLKQDPGARYVVRSSAVYSEDGEHTGAGIYKSILLPPNATPQEIEQQIIEVYKSVFSQEAESYRASFAISQEEMGLVIQKIAGGQETLESGMLGTVNTAMPGMPNLMEYQTIVGPHNLNGSPMDSTPPFRLRLPLNHMGALRDFGIPYPTHGGWESPRFHIPPDRYRHVPQHSWMATQAALLAEKAFGQPIQMEFCVTDDFKLHILQARPLPRNTLITSPFEGFPDHPTPLYMGRSVGVIDGVEAKALGVFRDIRDTIKREIARNPNMYFLFVEDSSFAKGDKVTEIMRHYSELSKAERKRIIVLIAGDSNGQSGGGGHIETLCASDLGVPLIFYDPDSPYRTTPPEGTVVTVYSNGLQGRIYAD